MLTIAIVHGTWSRALTCENFCQHLNPLLAVLSAKTLKQLAQRSQFLAMRDGDHLILHTSADDARGRGTGVARGGKDVLCLLLRGYANILVPDKPASKHSVGQTNTNTSGRAGTRFQQRLSVGHTCGGVSLLLAPDMLGLMCCASTCLLWHADAQLLRAVRQRHASIDQHTGALESSSSGACAEVLLVGREAFAELVAPILRQHVEGLTSLVRSGLPMLSQLPSEYIHECLDAAEIREWAPNRRRGEQTATGALGQLIVEEGAQEELGLHVLVLGSVDLASRDTLTSQVLIFITA